MVHVRITCFEPSTAHREEQGQNVPRNAIDSVAARVPRHDEGFQGRRGDEVPQGRREGGLTGRVQQEEAVESRACSKTSCAPWFQRIGRRGCRQSAEAGVGKEVGRQRLDQGGTGEEGQTGECQSRRLEIVADDLYV